MDCFVASAGMHQLLGHGPHPYQPVGRGSSRCTKCEFENTSMVLRGIVHKAIFAPPQSTYTPELVEESGAVFFVANSTPAIAFVHPEGTGVLLGQSQPVYILVSWV